MKHYVGHLVTPKDTEHYVLVSGCNDYNCAIVTSVDPFILVSEEGDMLWRHMDPHDFEYAGSATAKVLKICIERMNKDLRQDEISEHNANLMKGLFTHVSENLAKNDLEGFSRAVELMIQGRE